MSLPKDFPYHIVLASNSPRRRDLLDKLGFKFEAISLEIDESFPTTMKREDVPEYLAVKKSIACNLEEYPENTLLLTADTIVILENRIYGKPSNKEEAITMLYNLSGQTHKVVTGVCLRSNHKQESFSVLSEVTFRVLSLEEIEYYIDTYQPYDKAGAYGLQEWIGYSALEDLKGSFFNVMGLPTQRVYRALMEF